MRLYELTYLLPGNFSDAEIAVEREKVLNFLSQENAVIKNSSNPIKRKLGQKLEKRETVFQVTIVFELNPENIASLNKNLKSEKQILRYMLAIKDIFPEPQFRIRKSYRAEAEISMNEQGPAKKITREKQTEKNGEPAKKSVEKVELKEIDKKLDEILGE